MTTIKPLNRHLLTFFLESPSPSSGQTSSRTGFVLQKSQIFFWASAALGISGYKIRNPLDPDESSRQTWRTTLWRLQLGCSSSSEFPLKVSRWRGPRASLIPRRFADRLLLVNLNSHCFRCLCHAASRCNLTVGCDGGYCGPYKISKIYWKDAGEVILPDDEKGRAGG